MPKISVIVPIYRTEQYLSRCVRSILDQTFTDLEVILVDDGSPDGCGAICDAFALEDPRVRVIHKENQGVAIARNTGLDAATGDYIGFVDSDDCIHPQMYELLYHFARKDGSDIVSQAKKPSFHKDRYDFDADGKDRLILTPDQVLADFYNKYHDILWMSFTIKLIHRNVFEGLRFREGIIYEDGDLLPPVVRNSHRITVVPMQLYYYTLSDNSIMRCDFSPKYYMGLGVYRRYVLFFHDQKLPAQRDYYAMKYLFEMIGYYRITKEEHPELMEKLMPYIREYRKFRPFMRKNCHFSRLQRVLLESFPLCPRLAGKLKDLLDR